MMIGNMDNMQISVCKVPDGNGFRIESMPDFLLEDTFDDCSPHTHNFYEILWFKEGKGKHMVDFVEYDVKPNTLFFLSPGQIHHFDHNEGYCGITIKMCTDFMKDESATDSLFVKYNVFHTFDTVPYYRLDEATAEVLSRTVEAMKVEAQNNGEFGNAEYLKALLRIFLIKVLRRGMQDGELPLSNMKPSHLLFIRFRRMVEQEYMRMHTVQEYAYRLNVAQRTLNKCVNECSHTSPLAFINERIMLEAKRLIRYSNLMIKEIAFRLGYDDPSYFVKQFKKRTGYLPSDFRELDVN